MASITIDPLVELAEARALADHYRNRALLQAQAGAELRTLATDQAARIAALEAELTALRHDAPAVTAEGAA